MHLYFDSLPKIVADMRQRGYEGEDDLVHEAWFMMMFRAFCWHRCHFFREEQKQVYGAKILPSQYWSSKMPVYIG